MSKIRHIRGTDRIDRLYKVHDDAWEASVIPLESTLNPTGLELLDDVEALLTDPEKRDVAEMILRAALQDIAGHFVK